MSDRCAWVVFGIGLAAGFVALFADVVVFFIRLAHNG
jgi:hypothetical protein